MVIVRIQNLLLVAALAALTAGCASAPPADTSAEPQLAEDALRDEDYDVLFATEFPVASKDEALARAQAAMEAGDLDLALFFYVKALKFTPDDVQLLTAIGQLHEQRRNGLMAVRAYSLAIAIDGNNAQALENRGLLLLSNGEEERAALDLQNAVALDGGKWRSLNGLGIIADRGEDHADAERYYDAAIAVAGRLPILLNNRGYSRLLNGNLVGADGDLTEVAAGYDFPPALLNLGVLRGRQRMYAASIESFRRVLDLPDAMNRAAEIAMENGDYLDARDMLESAIRESAVYYAQAESNLARVEQALTQGS